jgi:RNA polymerase sigma-70 factor (ECF subfamily)
MHRNAAAASQITSTSIALDGEVAEVMEALHPKLFRYARFRLERPEAEDATSAALERMWRTRGSYRRQRGRLEPWLHMVGINAIRDEVRRRYRRPPTVQIDDLDLADRSADPDLIARLVDVRTALARLSQSDAELIGCRYGLGMSNEAIALVMKQTPGAIATAMHRALRRLRTEVTR